MAETRKHILEVFNSALDELEGEIVMMGSLVERNLRNAMTGLMERDDEVCSTVIADDEDIDTLEKQVDKDGIELLRRFQPVASDLRKVVTAMKLSGNLERIADQAKNIAKKARILNRVAGLEEVHLLEPLFNEAISMYRDVLRAYSLEDENEARVIKNRDKKVDRMNHDVAERLTQSMAQSPDRIADYLNLILIARNLERVGDHVKNIAEDIVYAVSAEDIRHTKTVAK